MRDLETISGTAPRSPGASPAHKFLVIGDSECGKTSLLDYYCNQRIKKKIKKTVGCEIHIKDLVKKHRGNLNIHQYIEFWDISGDSKFQPFINVYVKAIENNIHTFKGVIFFFDINNRKTLSRISKHLELLTFQHSNLDDEELYSLNRKKMTLPLLFIGNKIDLVERSDKFQKMQAAKQLIEQTLNRDPKIKCLFLSNQTNVADLQEIDKFCEDCITGNFEDLYLYDTVKEPSSPQKYKHYTRQKILSFTDGVGKFISHTLLRVRWFHRSVKNWINRDRYKRESLV